MNAPINHTSNNTVLGVPKKVLVFDLVYLEKLNYTSYDNEIKFVVFIKDKLRF